ncbi:MAG: flavodoxin family protein [Cetobacterium sp.]
MKTLITYSSKTGNTKKIAEAIHEGIPNATILPISDLINLDYDLIFIGGWIDRAIFDEVTLTLAKQIFNKKIVYFFTLGASPDSDHAKSCIKNIETILEENNNTILNKFYCQGAIDPKLISLFSSFDSNHKMAPTEERKKRWNDAKSHPDKNDLKNAKDFAISILNQN